MNSLNFTQLVLKKLNKYRRGSQSRKSFRSQTFSEHLTKFNDASLILSNIGLTESAWEVYRVNALYDFSYKRTKLYEYQKLLALNFQKAICESDELFYANSTVEIEVQIEKFPATAFNANKPALKITISALDISDECSTDECFEIFCGFLMSIERKEGLKEKERLCHEATILPLALVSYENKIFLQSFIDFLEENFSCIVSPLKFSSTDLKWILMLFSAPEDEKTSCSTVLEYESPCDRCKRIEIIIGAQSVHEAWNSVVKTGVEVITEDDVNKFFSVFENGFEKTVGIHLSLLRLCAIKTSVAAVRKDPSGHTVRAYNSNKLYLFMKHLTHLAQEF